MIHSLLLVGSLMLAADPTGAQIDKELQNSPGSQMPAEQKAMKKIKQNADMLQDAENLKKHKPKTCEDKCDFMEKEAGGATDHLDTTSKGKPVNDKTKKTMKKTMEAIVKACRESCEKKGKIDKDYLKEHMPKASSPYPEGGHWSGGGGGSSSDN